MNPDVCASLCLNVSKKRVCGAVSGDGLTSLIVRPSEPRQPSTSAFKSQLRVCKSATISVLSVERKLLVHCAFLIRIHIEEAFHSSPSPLQRLHDLRRHRRPTPPQDIGDGSCVFCLSHRSAKNTVGRQVDKYGMTNAPTAPVFQ